MVKHTTSKCIFPRKGCLCMLFVVDKRQSAEKFREKIRYLKRVNELKFRWITVIFLQTFLLFSLNLSNSISEPCSVPLCLFSSPCLFPLSLVQLLTDHYFRWLLSSITCYSKLRQRWMFSLKHVCLFVPLCSFACTSFNCQFWLVVCVLSLC